MAELLKFKRGLQANLDKAAFSDGTIYVTTDEQAIYVDAYVTNKDTGVREPSRLRLSDIVQIPSFADWQNMQPPYSSTALYYIIEQNALIKYTGDGTTHTWKQINSTAALETAINNLNKEVSTIKVVAENLRKEVGNKTTDTSSSDTIYGRLKHLEETDESVLERLSTAEENITKHSTAIGTAEDGANASGSLYARIAKNKADISNNTSAIGTLQHNVETLDNRVDALETKATEIDTLKTNLGEPTAAASSMNAFGRIKQLEEAKASQGTQISSLGETVAAQGNKITQNSAAIESLGKDFDELEDRVSDIESEIETLTGISGGITGLQNSIQNIESELNTVKSTVEGHTSSIGSLNAATEQLRKDVNENSGRLDTHQTNIETNAADIEALKTRATNAETSISTLSTKVTQNENSIKNLSTDVSTIAAVVEKIPDIYATKTELETTAQELNEAIDDRIKAANAMTYIGGVSFYKDLPTTGVKIGDTYIVLQTITDPNGSTYQAGDLLVASGTEVGGVITSNLVWSHVNTGYIDKHEPKLTTKANSTNDGVLLNLSSFTDTTQNGGLGSITLKADDSAATVSVSNNTITVGIEWDTF